MKKKTIDEKLLAFFQKKSDWLLEWFGIDNFDIARFLFCFSGFSIISADTHLFYVQKLNGLDIVLSVLLLFSMVRNLAHNEAGRRSVRNNPVFTNPNVLKFYYSRISTAPLGFVAILLIPAIFFLSEKSLQIKIYAIYISLYFISQTAGYYFSSCTPKPPSHAKKKWRKLTESIGQIGKKHIIITTKN